MYPLHLNTSISFKLSPQVYHSYKDIADLRQKLLGHPRRLTLHHILSTSNIIFPRNNFEHYIDCLVTKRHTLVFSLSTTCSIEPLELIHSNVQGPDPTKSCSGYIYYVLFIDDFSGFSWVFSLSFKAHVFDCFAHFHMMVERQLSKKLKVLHRNSGTKYLNHNFKSYPSKFGIIHQLSYPYTSAQNSVSERKHCHLIETTRALLHQFNMPYKFWVEAFQTTTYLINHLPTPPLSQFTI